MNPNRYEIEVGDFVYARSRTNKGTEWYEVTSIYGDPLYNKLNLVGAGIIINDGHFGGRGSFIPFSEIGHGEIKSNNIEEIEI